jgi:hypothetical protein
MTLRRRSRLLLEQHCGCRRPRSRWRWPWLSLLLLLLQRLLGLPRQQLLLR